MTHRSAPSVAPICISPNLMAQTTQIMAIPQHCWLMKRRIKTGQVIALHLGKLILPSFGIIFPPPYLLNSRLAYLCG